MQVDLVLFNGKVNIPEGILEAGIAVDNGRIVRIAKKTNLPHASVRLNMNGCQALPGLIDSHVHLRDQQQSYKEDFTTGTMAAAAGGVTTVIDMPNNRPVTMDSRSLGERMQRAEKRILVNVAFNSAFPEQTDEIEHIVKEGAIAFKLYLLQQIGGVDIDDDIALELSFKTIAALDVPIAVHAEDKSTLETEKKKVENMGRNDSEAFLAAHPSEAEVKAIKHVADLARRCGAHVHVCHLSSAAGLKTILEAKKTKLKLTCEVTPHHLFLTSKDIKRRGNLALTLPPLRTDVDNRALWQALRQGMVDIIASDHAPHSIEEKTLESVWDAKPGIPGLETTLPLMLTEVNKDRLRMSQLVQLISENPAQIFCIKDRGRLSEGNFADIVLVDMNQEHRIDASRFYSKAKFSPFDGWKVKGKIVKTFVNGQLVMDEGEIVSKPQTGRIIR